MVIIVETIKRNPRVTQQDLMFVTGLSQGGVEWNLAQLKAKGIIERVGATKKGHWKINRK